ncbi:2OG-Fe dioxygenase family protein [Vibrio agarivorans]|uniref:2OG-Fe dioxygenase family protein n=1 Tax=Vibrio agarivorans TaxID=153622 RepID=UPI00222FE9EC|nr:2OG-Fe dioxygenase family protein [Vibrio agarivorans]MDN3663627.1 2OG-Fe dioxygenase family protein [Vibrio agarivorans]
MFPSHANTLHLTSLSHDAVAQLSPSFNLLPHTEHADGQYRLRRYSVITLQHGEVIETGKHNFMQTDQINHFQGNVVRQFEPLLPQTLSSPGFLEMCELFVETNLLVEGQEIEVHQMRIAAVYDETQVAPEGVHQDGFDCIALIGIDRHNIVGGEVLLYQDNHAAPFYRKVLENGEIAMLDDHKLWHNAMPIRTVDHNQEGHMDVFVLTARKSQ